MAPVLKFYNVTEEAAIQCDASEKGLGATLLQKGQPVAFASQSLSKSEQNYAQIEKECLAIVFTCEHFNKYIHGRDYTTIHTDHRPLIPIFTKPIYNAPKRLQRRLLRLLTEIQPQSDVLSWQRDVHSRHAKPCISERDNIKKHIVK